MAIKVYQYPRCSTCRKALKWLDEQGIEYEAIDIVAKPPSKALLDRARKEGQLELKALFNTSGESYRSGGFKERLPQLGAAGALAALAADGKLIKRPLLIGEGVVLVGFKQDQWERALAR